jgi:hypothetical protein
MAGAKWTKSQVQGTQAAELNPNLFGNEPPSRADKMRETRKKTNEFQKWVIDYLNNTGQFKVWRNNNIPSTRKSLQKQWMQGTTRSGQIIEVEVLVEKVHFKAHQTDVSTFDVIGFRIWDGRHVEIEVKYGNDKLDVDQKKHLADLQKSDAISFVATGKDLLKKQIDPYMKEDLAF